MGMDCDEVLPSALCTGESSRALPAFFGIGVDCWVHSGRMKEGLLHWTAGLAAKTQKRESDGAVKKKRCPSTYPRRGRWVTH